ncbi:MAG: methyltransferase domain-containing protein [Nitrospinae bacterium]|nr:methyltransferase domain-containing protein [Nitrospinota bacterium]
MMDKIDEGITVSIGEAPQTLERLVGRMCGMPIDFSDVPLLPESTSPAELETLNLAAGYATSGNLARAYQTTSGPFVSWEFDYLRGKIMFSLQCYHEAARLFGRAVTRFAGYGELWFLYGIANYQMGLYSEAFMDWQEACRVNANHQDARLLLNLGVSMMKNTHTHLNPEAEFAIPVAEGKGIDVGCGGAKTHPAAIGVDIIPPGERGQDASQKGRVSQADVEASGDDMPMFEDGSLDYIIARHNLEHYVDPLKTLMEWRRVLKPGGVIALVLPDDDQFDTIHADSTHLHVFTKRSIKNLVSLVDGLKIASVGTCMNKWSFYAIIQKKPKGEQADFDYGRKLNLWLSKQAAGRAQSALAAGMAGVAASALRKLRELDPSAPLPADPDSLWPVPFQEHALQTANGLRVVVVGVGPGAGHTAGIIETLGHAVERVVAPGDSAPDWQVEKPVREFYAQVIVSDRLNPQLAEMAADMGILYLARPTWPVTAAEALRRDNEYGATLVFTPIREDVERLKDAGALGIKYLPPCAGVTGKPQARKTVDVLVVPPRTVRATYDGALDTLRSKLMDNTGTEKDKNGIFAALRRIGKIIESLGSDTPIPWGAAKEIVESLRVERFGLETDALLFALADEASARALDSIAATLREKGIDVAVGGGLMEAKICLSKIPAFTAQSLPPVALEAVSEGALLVTNTAPGLEAFFKPGVDFITCKNGDEAVGLAEKYLADGDAMERITASATTKAQGESLSASEAWSAMLAEAWRAMKGARP